jgi:hypothetical protein
MAHGRAPIDVYWDLMRDDKDAEAYALLVAHPESASCLLELGMRETDSVKQAEYWHRAVALGHPVAMSCLGELEEDSDLLARAALSSSPYARALAFQNLSNVGDQEEAIRIHDLYHEAMGQRESPRVYASFVDWSNLLDDRFEFDNILLFRSSTKVFAMKAACMGVPLGIVQYAECLMMEEDSPECNLEIVHQLTRPAVRQLRSAVRLLAYFYSSCMKMLDLGKAASLTLSQPAEANHRKIATMAGRIGVPIVVGEPPTLEQRWPEYCMYGRALALGTMGLPPVTEAFAGWVRPDNMLFPYGRFGNMVVQYEPYANAPKGQKKEWMNNVALLHHELRPMAHPEIDDWIADLAHNYRLWIALIRDTLMESLLVLQRVFLLPKDVAHLIVRMVWQARDADAALWYAVMVNRDDHNDNNYHVMHTKPRVHEVGWSVPLDDHFVQHKRLRLE